MRRTVLPVFLCALVHLLGPVNCFAQLPEHNVKLLTEQQGLHPAEFISMCRDREGFLWLVSQGGVQRFDGQQSWRYVVAEGAEEIFVDAKDRKWLKTRGGLYRFENDYRGFVRVNGLKADDRVVRLFAATGDLHLLLTTGIRSFDETTQSFVPPTRFSSSFIRASAGLHAENETHLFFGNTDSVYSIRKADGYCRSLALKQPATFTALSGDGLLVSAYGLVTHRIQTEVGTVQKISPPPTASSNRYLNVYCGVPVAGNNYLLATTLGLLHYNEATGAFRTPVLYHSGERWDNTAVIKQLCRDREGRIYLSHADGIAFFHPAQRGIVYLRHYNAGASLPDTDVRTFAEDGEGKIWIGTLNGVAALEPKTGALQVLNTAVSDNDYPSIRHLLFHRGMLWVGTSRKGLWLYHPKTRRYRLLRFSPDSTSRSTAATLGEEFVWRLVALQNGGVLVSAGKHCYEIDSTLLVKRLDKKSFPGISRMAMQDSAGRIWHGTATGLNCLTPDYRLLFSLRDSFPDPRVPALCEWKRDRILIGTRGLYEAVMQGNKLMAMKALRGLPPGRLIYAMEKDAAGKIWLATDEGLFRYDVVSQAAESFGTSEGVQPQVFNSNGLFRSRAGTVYAGGRGGLNFFDPAHLKKTTDPLRPRIAGFTVADDDSAFFLQPQPYAVAYTRRQLSVQVSVPDFEKPYALRYRYQLRPGEAWIENGNSRFIRLNTLSPGDYQLLVAASHEGETWYSAVAPLRFSVGSPWWAQAWALTLAAVMVALAVYAMMRRRENLRRKREYQKTIDYFAHSGYEHSAVEDVLWDIARNCISRLGFEECVIYLLDKERKVLVQKAAYGAKSPRVFEIIDPIEIPVGKGITGSVAASGVAEVVSDTRKDPRYVVDDDVRLSEIAVPIVHKGEVIGVIDSEARRKGFFTAEHLRTLKTIASICSAKISRGLAHAERQKAEALLRDVNTKLLETKFMNLRLQMNPHFLFNALSSIQHLVVSEQSGEAYAYLSIFSGFLRSLLQYADQNAITLAAEMKMLNQYVKLEQLGSDKGFAFTIDADESLDPEDVWLPPLLIQPLVENAVWHGLMQKEGARRLSVFFAAEGDDNLVCVVDDNGIGREASAQRKGKTLPGVAHQSKATALLSERLHLLTQRTGKPARMVVEDKCEGGEAAGTQVRIILPFYNPDEL